MIKNLYFVDMDLSRGLCYCSELRPLTLFVLKAQLDMQVISIHSARLVGSQRRAGQAVL